MTRSSIERALLAAWLSAAVAACTGPSAAPPPPDRHDGFVQGWLMYQGGNLGEEHMLDGASIAIVSNDTALLHARERACASLPVSAQEGAQGEQADSAAAAAYRAATLVSAKADSNGNFIVHIPRVPDGGAIRFVADARYGRRRYHWDKRTYVNHGTAVDLDLDTQHGDVESPCAKYREEVDSGVVAPPSLRSAAKVPRAGKATTHVVSLGGSLFHPRFSPKRLVVAAGDSVRFASGFFVTFYTDELSFAAETALKRALADATETGPPTTTDSSIMVIDNKPFTLPFGDLPPGHYRFSSMYERETMATIVVP